MKIPETVRILNSRYKGWLFIRILSYPVTILFTTPIRLIQSLWNSRILLEGKDWEYYPHFKARISFNSLFYFTRALNLSKYGRSGKAPYLGLGDYSLTRCFHYSLFSLYGYWRAGAVVIIVGMFSWLCMHFAWVHEIQFSWFMLVLYLVLISTTFYANLFGTQNYNVIGWIFFPIAIFGLVNDYYLLAGFAVFLAGFGSFTVVFLLNIIFVIVAIEQFNILPILSLLPGNFKLLLHFYPFLKQESFVIILNNVLKAIGVRSKNNKYRRTNTKKITKHVLYYTILYTQFIIVYYILFSKLPSLFFIGFVVFIINTTFLRFADPQSLQMQMFSLSIVEILQHPNLFLLTSFWILASPLPMQAFSGRLEYFFDIVPKFKPFSMKPFIDGMEEFLKEIKRGERVLLALNDPNDIYENIFDGYRTIYELPLYLAAKRDIHLLPDWWAVFELNYQGAPGFWGRDVNSVLKNIKLWKTKYVIIYQTDKPSLDSKWTDAGFKVLNKFSWKDYLQLLGEDIPFKGEAPYWWLLKIPVNVDQR